MSIAFTARRSWRPVRLLGHASSQHRAARSISIPQSTSYPIIQDCPAPTCGCAATPTDLDIDHDAPLNGTMAPYAQHVLVCTGKDDWTSRIEEDDGKGGQFVKGLKGLLGRGGQFSDPFNSIMVTNSSFSDSSLERPDSIASSLSTFLFPSFEHVRSIPLEREALKDFTRGFLLPRQVHKMHAERPAEEREALQLDPDLQRRFQSRRIREVFVLICGHGGRDARCGVMGPLLRFEFNASLARKGFSIQKDHGASEETKKDVMFDQDDSRESSARVGLISHIGGHKFAGNVIVYMPPSFEAVPGRMHPLAGKGIWYGRVEPKHVEGIVQETIIGGNVIAPLFRGGVGRDGEILRI